MKKNIKHADMVSISELKPDLYVDELLIEKWTMQTSELIKSLIIKYPGLVKIVVEDSTALKRLDKNDFINLKYGIVVLRNSKSLEIYGEHDIRIIFAKEDELKEFIDKKEFDFEAIIFEQE